MTGLPGNNFPAFFKAEKQLRRRGFIPVNPALNPPGLCQADYMIIDLAMLSICEGIMMLDGWEDSIGARAENAMAISLRLPVFNITDLLNQYPLI